MRIELNNLSQMTGIKNDAAPQKKVPTNAQEAAGDQIRTSDRALMLSRNMEALRENTDVRPEVLSKYAGIAAAPFELDDATIDSILDKMQK
ncbi:MAG: hypothetical protein JXR25_04870 [Pontiellaceae bacterium]|nr:hypothetical protein [Pontiellaceae bacterium]MBN2784139.1 hypothetical protein [Pontiellaceae bacterium]